jgi:hypothetical protein
MSNVEIINDFGADNQKKQLKNLPAKYNKFAVFSFWLSEKIRESSPEAADAIANLANIRSRDVPSQIEFYEEFVSQEKIHAKALRTIILAKPKKEKLPKENKPRKPRAKKDSAVEQVTNNDIISQIVSRANSVEEVEEEFEIDVQEQLDIPDYKPKEKVVKQPKEKVVKQPKEKVVKEPKEKVVKQPKEKVVKEPKEKVVKEKVVKEPKEKVVKEKVVKEKAKPKEKKEKVLKEVKEKVIVVEKEVQMDEDEEHQHQDGDEDEEDLQLTLISNDRYQDANGNFYDLEFNHIS